MQRTSSRVVRGDRITTHPLTILCMRGFVEMPEEWKETPWSTTVDILFIIAGCTDQPVIFDLRFKMTLPDGDPVLEMDPIIGRILGQDEVKCVIMLWREAVWEPDEELREESRESEELLVDQGEEDAVLLFAGTVKSPDHSEWRAERDVKR